MNVTITPVGPLSGAVTPPADKSISHRAALLGAMTAEPVRIRNYLDSADTHATLDALRALGTLFESRPDEIVVRGVGLRAVEESASAIDVRNSGTLMRLLPGWLAAQPGLSWVLDGDASIRRRPVDRIARPLEAMGARIDAHEGRFPPFTVHGALLRGMEYTLPVASAQVKSCLILAGLLTEEGVTIHEPLPSRDHTERILARTGEPVERVDGALKVVCVDELELEDIDVPGDLSSAAFLIAAALLVPRSRIRLRGVGVNWTRTGFVRIARRMGARIEGDLEPVGAVADREPVADLDVRAGPLVGTQVEPDEVPLTIDELPLVALLGAVAEGETVVRGAAELRVKESDRIAAVVEGLRGLGADIEATEDGFAVRGGTLRGGRIASRGDHRLAMLGAVAGLVAPDGVTIEGMEAAAVSYPGFLDDLNRLGTGTLA